MLAVLLLSVMSHVRFLWSVLLVEPVNDYWVYCCTELNCMSNTAKWTSFVTWFVVFRLNALWMAMSFHATCRSYRSSLRGRNMRNWVLQQSSTTASMNHTLCQAQNNRKEILFAISSLCKKKTPPSLLLAALAVIVKEIPQGDGLNVCEANLHFVVCCLVWCFLFVFQQSALL